MSRIRSKDTKPEFLIRKSLFSLGYRYRLHQHQLPGCPDIVLQKYNTVIFVHGCLWHGHDCGLFHWPKNNATFWRRKITGNQRNDAKSQRALRSSGWRVITVWECALRGRHRQELSVVIRRIARSLSSSAGKHFEIAGSRH
jgi:DNA mismatch endonuclease (patch repair protein)